MRTGWPVDVDGDAFAPVPESWIEAGTDAGTGRPRLYAVSAGVVGGGRCLRIRYAHPRTANVLPETAEAVENAEGTGLLPASLATRGTDWARSLVPREDAPPQDVLRLAESRHLRDLWGPRVDEVPTDREARRRVTDGGKAAAHCRDVAQRHLSPEFWRESR